MNNIESAEKFMESKNYFAGEEEMDILASMRELLPKVPSFDDFIF